MTDMAETTTGSAQRPLTDQSARHVAYIEADFVSLQRGGSTRVALCTCGWKGPQRATLEMVTDDALEHERSSQADRRSNRRDELVKRLVSNKAWLSKNCHLAKAVRHGCLANIAADEQAVAELDELIGTENTK